MRGAKARFRRRGADGAGATLLPGRTRRGRVRVARWLAGPHVVIGRVVIINGVTVAGRAVVAG